MLLDVCIDQLFPNSDFFQAMEITKDAGVEAYEFWKWWTKDIDGIVKKQNELQMQCTCFCTRFISLVDPNLRGEFLQGLQATIEVAKRFNTNKIIAQTGNEIVGLSRNEQLNNIILGIKYAVPFLEKSGMTLLIEPLNQIDHPGYFLCNSDESFKLIDEVGSGNIKILYDIYHFQITEGNLINTISAHISQIGHFHCAGIPGRGEITKGEINYKEIFRAINNLGYTGYLGLEFRINSDHKNIINEALEIFSSAM